MFTETRNLEELHKRLVCIDVCVCLFVHVCLCVRVVCMVKDLMFFMSGEKRLKTPSEVVFIKANVLDNDIHSSWTKSKQTSLCQHSLPDQHDLWPPLTSTV